MTETFTVLEFHLLVGTNSLEISTSVREREMISSRFSKSHMA